MYFEVQKDRKLFVTKSFIKSRNKPYSKYLTSASFGFHYWSKISSCNLGSEAKMKTYLPILFDHSENISLVLKS